MSRLTFRRNTDRSPSSCRTFGMSVEDFHYPTKNDLLLLTYIHLFTPLFTGASQRIRGNNINKFPGVIPGPCCGHSPL